MFSKKSLLVFLAATVAASGRPAENQCASDSTSSLDNDSIDCADADSSIKALVSELGGSSSAIITEEDDAAYQNVTQQYASASVATDPSIVVQAQDKLDVQATIMFANQCEYKLTTRSGGHSYLGISSCDGDEFPCIQLDVRGINHIDVVELTGNRGKQLRVGPGTILEELADKFVEEGVFIPTGECTDVGVGGHQQTGGLSASWGRTFGYFAHHVESFEIILSDGSLKSVTKPNGGSTSKSKDDLFYAVLGGASGSFGVIVETTFNTFKDEDYFAQYWEVNFLYDGSTFDGIVDMARKFTEMLEDEDFRDDPRWNIEWTIIGGKTLYELAFQKAMLPTPGFNFIQLDFTYIVPTNGLKEDEAKLEAQDIYDTLLEACTDCVLLDEYFESLGPPFEAILKGQFASVYNATGPISQFISELTLFDYSKFEVAPFPYQTSWQQGPQYPGKDDFEGILRAINDNIMPTWTGAPALPSDYVFVVVQMVTLPSQLHATSDIALPFQEDVYGIDVGVFDLTGGGIVPVLRNELDQVRGMVVAATGGEDHRMFWNPNVDEDVCLACGDFEFYYEDENKFDTLRSIKSCVDPNNLFDNRMSMPLDDE